MSQMSLFAWKSEEKLALIAADQERVENWILTNLHHAPARTLDEILEQALGVSRWMGIERNLPYEVHYPYLDEQGGDQFLDFTIPPMIELEAK